MRTQSIRLALAIVLLSPCASISLGGFMFSRTRFRQSREKSYLGKFCLIIISLSIFSIHIQAQDGWTKKTTIPTLRAGASAEIVNGQIYIIGGNSGTPNFSNLAVNEMYDPITNKWETKQPMPTPRGFFASGVVNDTIYAIGGGYSSGSSIVEAYDPVTNTWSTKANMLNPRFCMRAAVVDGIIYIFCGNYNEHNCQAYDPATNKWTEKAPIPSDGGGNLSVTSYDNRLIYTFGGSSNSSSSEPWQALSTVYEYNPKTDLWTKKKDMPTPRFGVGIYLVNGKIYAIGGSQSRNTSLATVEVYDPVTDTWGTKPNMPFSSFDFARAVVDNKIYVISGTPDWATGDGAIWEYDPAFPESGLAYALYARFSRHGRDTVGITARVENPLAHVFNVVAVLTSGTQALIDSMLLKDDGLHGDSVAADGLWGYQYVPKKDDTIRVTIRTDDLTAGASQTLPDAAQIVFTRGAVITVDARTVVFDDIDRTVSRYDTAFAVRNIGYAADSLAVSLDPVNVVPDTAVTVFPRLFVLAPGDSQKVTFSIHPNLLMPSYYSAQVIVESQSAFGQRKFWKNYYFSVITSVSDLAGVPKEFGLGQNFPNPFNPSTTIRYGLPNRSHVSLAVFNTLGQQVALLQNGEQEAGYHEVTFDASGVSSGVYFYRMQAGQFIQTRKLLLLR